MTGTLLLPLLLPNGWLLKWGYHKMDGLQKLLFIWMIWTCPHFRKTQNKRPGCAINIPKESIRANKQSGDSMGYWFPRSLPPKKNDRQSGSSSPEGQNRTDMLKENKQTNNNNNKKNKNKNNNNHHHNNQPTSQPASQPASLPASQPTNQQPTTNNQQQPRARTRTRIAWG